MGSRLLLEKASRFHPRGERGAVLTAASTVAAIVLTLTGAAVVQLSTSHLRGAAASSDAGHARAAASEGIKLMISTWNEPENRALLVSGEDPATWAVASLTTPCSPSDPPDQTALDLADGSWRDVMTGAVANETTDGLQFRLLSISFTANDPATSTHNPRELRRRFAGNPIGGAGPVDDPTGSPPPTWDSLVNLSDPDGPGPLQPGGNSGYLVLEVAGREVRGGREVASSCLTQEFQVLPKRCDCSLGSGGAESLGADRRPCPPPTPPGTPSGDWVARGPTSSRLW